MSVYALQKLIRDFNRSAEVRTSFIDSPDQVMARYELCTEERAALRARDFGTLYRLGVHGLLLRPFSILHSTSEQDYLTAIRADG